jgi:hypothetical protein
MNYLTGLILLAGLKLNGQIADAANVRRRLFPGGRKIKAAKK